MRTNRAPKFALATVVAVVAVACCSDAHATQIVIDTFEEGKEQQAPPDSRLALPSVLGGSRLLTASGDVTVVVADGLLQPFNLNSPGGTGAAVWDGGEGQVLGGVDLTDASSNDSFEVVVVGLSLDVGPNESLGVIVQDSSGIEGRFDIGWSELDLGSNLIPFSSLSNGVDLTSIDVVRLENEIVGDDQFILIGSFSAVPEPATLSLGLVCCCFLLAGRRRRH